MRFIRSIYQERRSTGRPVLSFELYPPKTEDGDRVLFEKTLPDMMRLKPDYCSVTYGAGGGTREKTLAIADRIQRDHGVPGLAHLTCVGQTQEQIAEVARRLAGLGIQNILALRGDPPGGVGEFKKTEGGFEFSYQLIRFLKQLGDFSVGTAGFPEGHVACKEGKIVDWDRLKAKIDEGADFVLTQLFFDNNDFFIFREHMMKRLGVAVPIVPGILPILGADQIKRFSELCGARLPQTLWEQLSRLGANNDAVIDFGIEYTTAQCAELLSEGVAGLHLYTLNKAHSIGKILRNLGLADGKAL